MSEQQGVPDGWEVVPTTAPQSTTAGHWEDRGIAGQVWHPAAGGSERTRQDTNIIGLDREGIQHRIADWASKLPAAWQKPAAMLVGAPADILASLVEAVSAPESVATMGARPAMAAMDTAAQAAKNVVPATVRGVATVGDVIDPAVIGMVSPRGANVVRSAQKVRSAMTPVATPVTAATAPVEAAPAAAPSVSTPAVPKAVPTAAPSTMEVMNAFKAVQQMPQGGEITNALAFMKRGFSADESVAKVIANRPAPKASAPPKAAPKPKTPPSDWFDEWAASHTPEQIEDLLRSEEGRTMTGDIKSQLEATLAAKRRRK